MNDSTTLDPDNWNQTRELAVQIVDDLLAWHRNASEGPAWTEPPAQIRTEIAEQLPRDGQALDDVYRLVTTHIRPYTTGNHHPRFFGWAVTNGTVIGMLADLIASGLNPHMAGFNQTPADIEETVISWMAEIFGFPPDASGVLVSGGTMANLNGLATARQAKAGWDVRKEGLTRKPQFTVYASQHVHSWLYKACSLLGLGEAAVRAVPVAADFRMDIDACRSMIEADRTAGARPFCIVGTSGTTSTGAIDDLPAIRRLADEMNIWFHVDAALGGLAALTPCDADQVVGQELADSLAFDLHKWGYLPYDIAGVLVRDPSAHASAFAYAPDYLVSATRGVSVDTTRFSDRGLDLSRSFRALKAWMSFKHHGANHIGAVIQKNIDQIRSLARRAANHPKLECLAPPGINVLCYRYVAGDCDDAQLNKINDEIIVQLQTRGIAIPSRTVLEGKTAIRICNVNHRTVERDLEILIEATVDLGDEIHRSQSNATSELGVET